MSNDFYYEIKENGIDEIVDEYPGTNSYIALREIRWNENDDFKLDIRKYFVKSDGTESIGKGLSFATPAGPGMLASKLIEHGYGDTSSLTQILLGRDYSGVMDGIIEHCDYDLQFEEFVKDLQVAYDVSKEEKKSAKDMLDEILK